MKRKYTKTLDPLISYPAHHACYSLKNRKTWTFEDEEKLMKLIDVDNFSFRKTATILKRTYTSIREKRKNLRARNNVY